MTLRHLSIFLTVCKENNMTKAAQKLYITQPSVTQAIKELEIYYNVQLFERNGKKIAISKDGYKLCRWLVTIIYSYLKSYLV